MKNVVGIFAKDQKRRNCRSLFRSDHVISVKLLTFTKNNFTAILIKNFKTSMNISLVLRPMTQMMEFLRNIKLELLQMTVLKQWEDLSKAVIFLEKNLLLLSKCFF